MTLHLRGEQNCFSSVSKVPRQCLLDLSIKVLLREGKVLGSKRYSFLV